MWILLSKSQGIFDTTVTLSHLVMMMLRDPSTISLQECMLTDTWVLLFRVCHDFSCIFFVLGRHIYGK